MRAVNLLPQDRGQRTIKKESLPVLIGACSGVLVAAVLGAMFMMGSGKIAAQQRKTDDLNRIYQALPPPPAGRLADGAPHRRPRFAPAPSTTPSSTIAAPRA